MSLKVIDVVKKILVVILIVSCFNFVRVGYWILFAPPQNVDADFKLSSFEKKFNKAVKDNDVKNYDDSNQENKIAHNENNTIDEWEIIVKNNLFKTEQQNEIKHKAEERDNEEKKKKEENLDFSLQAISNTESSSRAILFNHAENKSYILKQGEEFGGKYIMKAIKKDKVILATAEKDIELKFKENN